MRHSISVGVVVISSLLTGCDGNGGDDGICICDSDGRSCVSPTEGTCGTCVDRFTCRRFKGVAGLSADGCKRACAFREAFLEGPPAAREVQDDLNGDKIPDLASLALGVSLVRVSIGRGEGKYQDVWRELYAGGAPSDLVAYDLNKDGIPDLVTASPNEDSVWVLLGNGDGSFGEALDYYAGHRPTVLAVDDVNGDGNPDLVAVSAASGEASSLLGAGDGTFEIAKVCSCP